MTALAARNGTPPSDPLGLETVGEHAESRHATLHMLQSTQLHRIGCRTLTAALTG